MHRSPKWAPLAALAATLALVFAACGSTATSPSAPASAEVPSEAPPSAGPFDGLVYPETGEAPCGTDTYTGNFKKITATDAQTVVFDLCNPDVAFLSKIAFSAFAVNDTAWLEAKVDPSKPDNQAIVSEVNGTGPYKLSAWNRGTNITMTRNDAYWGDKAKAETLIFQWSTEATTRLNDLRSGVVDGIDNLGGTDFAAVEGDTSLQLKPREGLNVMYFGFNNTFAPFDNEKVRQAIAMGIDRQRLVDDFMPPGSEVASHFTPCAIPNACVGDSWYEFDPAAAKALLAEAGFPEGFDDQDPVPRRVPRLRAGPERHRGGPAGSSSRPT